MNTEKEIKEKWKEVIDYATQHAKNQGMHKGFAWLRDAFNEYLAMSDEVPGYGMGGQPGSMHNRQVLAEKIVLELGSFVGGRHLLDDTQMAELKETLNEVVNERNGNQLKR